MLITASCLALGLSACGGGSSTSSGDGSTAVEQAAPEAESQAGGGGASEASTQVASVAKPPEVSVPPGPPPKQLVVKDLKKGTGATLDWGDEMSVRYIALNYRTRGVVERHWLEPFSWGFGPGQVVRAWVLGLRGMKVGGVRELIAPSRLAYKQGARMWVVELLSASGSSG
jgi:peptidylprolyl isomerase